MTTYPHPACMEPDGGDGPCAGYKTLEAKVAVLEDRICRAKDMIDGGAPNIAISILNGE